MYINWPTCGYASGPPTLPNPGLSGYLGLGCGTGCQSCQMCRQKGLGYFDTGWDISGWGLPEWGTVLIGVYVLMYTFFTTQRGYRKAQRSVKRLRQRRMAA